VSLMIFTISTSRVLTARPDDPTDHEPTSALARKPSLPSGYPGWLFSLRPWNSRGSLWRPWSNTLRSLPLVAWWRCRGCPSIVDTPYSPRRQTVRAKCPECDYHSHILAGLGEGRALPPPPSWLITMAYSTSSAYLCWSSSTSWASIAARSPHRYEALCSVSSCRVPSCSS
jgi:hypothetical protein